MNAAARATFGNFTASVTRLILLNGPTTQQTRYFCQKLTSFSSFASQLNFTIIHIYFELLLLTDFIDLIVLLL